MSGHKSLYRDQQEAAFNADPRAFDRMVRQKYGMSASDLQDVLPGLVDLANGKLPSGKAFAYIKGEASAKYGWNEKQVRAELQKAIDCSTNPTARLHAYLTTNGRHEVPSEYLQHAVDVITHSAAADLELSLAERLDNSQSNHRLQDRFEGMPTTKRVAEESKSRGDLRDLLRIQMGIGIPEYKTFGIKQDAVMNARRQVADRLEAHAAKQSRGETTSLRDDLKMNYEVASVRDASIEHGLGDPIQNAEDDYATTHGHLADDYDPLTQIEDI